MRCVIQKVTHASVTVGGETVGKIADGREYFWIGPGRFGKDGKSSIKAVYLDKVELSIAK